MAPRAIWKGVLTLSLVSIPIKVFAATESSEKLDFNQLHQPCQSRVTQQRWCATCEREVPSAEIVKGFEFEKGKYVILLPAELDAVQPQSTRVIAVTRFAPAEQLELRSIDRAYFLEADGDGRVDEAFRTVQAAMHGRIGVGTLTLYGREYLVAIGLQRGVLLLYTLHHAAELRDLPTAPSTADASLPGVREARQLFIAMTQPLDLSVFPNQYHVDVRRLIDAKIAGHEFVESASVDTAPALPLLEALTQSLAAMTGTKRPMAKATVAPKRKRAS
jgi:DNA end-binding protein Ku